MTIDRHDLTSIHDRASDLTRRDLLGRTAQVGAAAAIGGSLLAGCGGSSSSTTGGSSTQTSGPHGLSALPAGTPKRGGTFTVGAISDGTAETLYPGSALVPADWSRQYSLFEPLFYPGVNVYPMVPGLCLSAEPNADATKWTFHLRDGVTWHDGKPFTADDVVYNFHVPWSNAVNNESGFLNGICDPTQAKKVGPLTVEVPLLKPVAQFPTILAFYGFLLIQNGATKADVESKPIGTGPFVFESFTPGQQSVFKANPSYWQTGKPYVDKLIVDSSYTDPTALFNALLSGQVNLLPQCPLTNARAQLTSKQVQILESPPSAQNFAFCQRVDKGPFADNRIRTAFKLLMDREAMIEASLSGFGVPAYDVPGLGSQYFASDLVRKQDVEQAKSLLKAAGVAGHSFTLQTGPAFSGQVQSATILAEQASAAGITVKVQTISAATYFTPAGGFLSRYFGQEVNESNASLTTVYRAELAAGSPYYDTHWVSGPQGPARNAQIQAAIAELDETKANQLWHTAQEAQFNEGGYLWWTAFPFVDAAANNIRGLTAGAGFNFNNWKFADGWID